MDITTLYDIGQQVYFIDGLVSFSGGIAGGNAAVPVIRKDTISSIRVYATETKYVVTTYNKVIDEAKIYTTYAAAETAIRNSVDGLLDTYYTEPV